MNGDEDEDDHIYSETYLKSVMMINLRISCELSLCQFSAVTISPMLTCWAVVSHKDFPLSCSQSLKPYETLLA